MTKNKHGLSTSREYKAWMNMKTRCENPNTPFWKNYGGRGIAICYRWRKFENFLADMGPRPGAGYSLDRIDVNGNYEPENCRWATQKTQTRNLRRNSIVRFKGRMMPLAEAVDLTTHTYNTVLYRLRRGWSEESALTEPLRRGRGLK